MHDESAHHPPPFPHTPMRLVEESSFLVQREFVHEASAGRDGVLREPRTAVHIKWNFETVPVHRSWLGQVVIDHNPHTVALIHLNCWAWGRAVVAPQVYCLAAKKNLLHRLGDQMKNLHAAG